jgi:hypothetical protein
MIWQKSSDSLLQACEQLSSQEESGVRAESCHVNTLPKGQRPYC